MFSIFNFKGKINRSLFILNYIILMIIFWGTGFLLLPAAIKNEYYIISALVFLAINTLVFFNYKKRLLEITENLTLSVILGLVFAFDYMILPYAASLSSKFYLECFFTGLFFIFCIQPIACAVFPAKKVQEKDAQ